MATAKPSRRESLIKKIKSGDKTAQTTSYLKRKRTLKKKSLELQTLCDVSVCMVCFGPDGDVTTWPESKREVEALVKSFKELERRSEKRINVEGLLCDEKKRVERKRSKMLLKEKKKLEIDMDNWLNGLEDPTSLKNYVNYLDTITSRCKERVEYKKLSQEQEEEKRKEKEKDTCDINDSGFIGLPSGNCFSINSSASSLQSDCAFNCSCNTTSLDSNMQQNCIMINGSLEGPNCNSLQEFYGATNFASGNLIGANASGYNVLPSNGIVFKSCTTLNNCLMNDDNVCGEGIWDQYYTTTTGPECTYNSNNSFYCYGDNSYYSNFFGNNYCQQFQFDQSHG